MDVQAFKTAYEQVRNGADHMIRHALVPSFLYSDGVEECANAGCHWLIDILATEIPGVFRAKGYQFVSYISVKVVDRKAVIEGTFDAIEEVTYRRTIDVTDLPAGKWDFYIAKEADENNRHHFVCILMSEY